MPWKFFSSEGAELVTLKKPEMRTSLPATANDGDEIILTDSLSAGTYHWHLRYVAARSSNKWVFVGGSPQYHEIATRETTSSTAAGDLATVGPTVTVAVAGTYIARMVAQSDVSATTTYAIAGLKVGSGAAADDMYIFPGVAGADIHMAHEKSFTAAASDVVKMQYHTSGAGTAGFSRRGLFVTPVAIGG